MSLEKIGESIYLIHVGNDSYKICRMEDIRKGAGDILYKDLYISKNVFSRNQALAVLNSDNHDGLDYRAYPVSEIGMTYLHDVEGFLEQFAEHYPNGREAILNADRKERFLDQLRVNFAKGRTYYEALYRIVERDLAKKNPISA